MSTPAPCPQSRRFLATLDSADTIVAACLAGLPAEVALARPAPGAWSVAECLDHLVVSARGYEVHLAPALAEARTRGMTGAPPYGRGTAVGRMLLGALDPGRKSGRSLKAPGVFRPAPAAESDWTAVQADFARSQVRWRELVDAASGLDLGAIVIPTPVSGLLKVTAAQAFGIHDFHIPRHLAQALRTLDVVHDNVGAVG